MQECVHAVLAAGPAGWSGNTQAETDSTSTLASHTLPVAGPVCPYRGNPAEEPPPAEGAPCLRTPWAPRLPSSADAARFRRGAARRVCLPRGALGPAPGGEHRRIAGAAL